MLRLALASVLLAFPASAQPSGTSADSLQTTTEAGGPTRGERIVLVGAALGSGAVSVLFPPAAPFAVAGGTYLAGRWLGYDAALWEVAVDGLIGGAVGFAVAGGTTFYLTGVEGQTADLGTSLFSAGAGLAAMAVTTALLYDGQRVRTAPVGLRALTGGSALAISLSVDL